VRTYSATEVAAKAGISYRRVDYMARSGFAVPSVPARGSGSRRRYSREDVVRIVLTVKLLDAGVSWDQLRRDDDPLTTARRMHRALTPIVEAAAA
jgi:DNA-binding transcriptional MerR regulator